MLPDRPQLEPKAVEILEAMSERLAAARTMTFTATVTYEAPARTGQPLAYTTLSEVTLHLEADSDVIVEENRPVRLRAQNVFSPALRNYAASTIVYVPRPAKVQTIEVGQMQ